MLRFKLSFVLVFIVLLGYGQVAFTFIPIPAGNYTLGAKGHHINPLHNYQIKKTIYISNTEITNAQFDSFVVATNYITTAQKSHNARVFVPGLRAYEWLNDSTAYWRYPNGISHGGITNKMNHPVTCISYTDALAFCTWYKVRLPNINEWEIASRAGCNDKYFFGNDGKKNLPIYANIWYGNSHLNADTTDAYMYTAPVGSFAPNAWGFYDVYGNVFEFCSGINSYNKNKKHIAIARGGSWWCSQNTCSFFNSIDMGRTSIYSSFSNQGFRVVKNSLP
jgi:formylglycine-generating enzyme